VTGSVRLTGDLYAALSATAGDGAAAGGALGAQPRARLASEATSVSAAGSLASGAALRHARARTATAISVGDAMGHALSSTGLHRTGGDAIMCVQEEA